MGVPRLLKFLDFELLKNTVVIFVHRVSSLALNTFASNTS